MTGTCGQRFVLGLPGRRYVHARHQFYSFDTHTHQLLCCISSAGGFAGVSQSGLVHSSKVVNITKVADVSVEAAANDEITRLAIKTCRSGIQFLIHVDATMMPHRFLKSLQDVATARFATFQCAAAARIIQ